MKILKTASAVVMLVMLLAASGCTVVYEYPSYIAPPVATVTEKTAVAEQMTVTPIKPRELTKEEVEEVAVRAYAALGLTPDGSQIVSFEIRPTRTPGKNCEDGTQPRHVKSAEDSEYWYDRWHCPRDRRR